MSSCIDDSQLNIKAVSPRIEIGHFDHDFFGMDSINFDDDLLILMKQYPDFFKIGLDHAILKKSIF